MRKLKITEFISSSNAYDEINFYNKKGELITVIKGINRKEDAQLIADAFNTANKCDMLPSELANKYENLLQNISRTIADLVVEKEKQLFIIGNDSDLDKIRVATEQKIGLNFAISYLNDMLEFDKNN